MKSVRRYESDYGRRRFDILLDSKEYDDSENTV